MRGSFCQDCVLLCECRTVARNTAECMPGRGAGGGAGGGWDTIRSWVNMNRGCVHMSVCAYGGIVENCVLHDREYWDTGPGEGG